MDVASSETCLFPGCTDVATQSRQHNTTVRIWCARHWGLFPPPCEQPGCISRPAYDDEPFCFAHSPDEGSSFKDYSAVKKFLAAQNRDTQAV